MSQWPPVLLSTKLADPPLGSTVKMPSPVYAGARPYAKTAGLRDELASLFDRLGDLRDRQRHDN
jgi:hypothetical protein